MKMTQHVRLHIIKAHLSDMSSFARYMKNQGDAAYLQSKIRYIQALIKKGVRSPAKEPK